ncbi:unnamed protein product [Mortierella alpina]
MSTPTATTSIATPPASTSVGLTSFPSATTSPSLYPTASYMTSSTNSGSSGSYDPSSALTGALPLSTVFYFIAFIGLMLAVFYTVYLATRDRRRRRAARANGGRDPEMGERRANTTYRPDSGDEASPPQYRAYMLDQPFEDTGVAIVYPDQVHHGDQQGLIQHLAILGQHGQEYSSREDDQDSTRPILTTTITTTTTTTTTTTLSPPGSPRAVATATIAGAGQLSTAAVDGEPQSAAAPVAVASTETEIPEPAPAHQHAFLTGRHFSILRLGLGNHNSSRESSRRTSLASTANTSPTASRSSSPSRRHSAMVLLHPVSPDSTAESSSTTAASISSATTNTDTSSAVAQTQQRTVTFDATGDGSSAMTERSEDGDHRRRSGIVVMPPSLYRLRSTGPPPYIPLSPEEAPPLPPSYNAAVEV